MCGIVGYYCNEEGRDLNAGLADAVMSLSHRGPDDMGMVTFLDGRAGLGHRRLSVIDLSEKGRQPMADEGASVFIVYNGEIYNFAAIRDELEGLGHCFSSRTDTEVILKAYLQWGMGCLERLRGMFAFGIFDRRDSCLYLARDRIGIKPLYYHKGPATVLFASELKAMMAFQDFQRDVDQDALALYLHYQYVPSPFTIFKRTFKLPPGHYMKFDGKDLSIFCYWNPPLCTSPIKGEEEWLDELEGLIEMSAREHLVSDVPLGALLSGGIDSTIVAALLQRVADRPIKTFTIGFREKAYNEAPMAERAAELLGTEHTEIYVTPSEAMEVIPSIPFIYDEPFADASAIPTCLVSRLARSQVTVALSGDGGDEQFCGYVRYWSAVSMAAIMGRIPSGARSSLRRLMEAVPLPLAGALYHSLAGFIPQRLRIANFADKWQKMAAIIGEDDLQEIYRTTVSLWSREEIRRLTGMETLHGRFEDSLGKSVGVDPLARLMRTDLLTYLPDCMLTKVDRASMAVGLEVRVPLLDHRIVEFSMRLPPALKYRNGRGKYILRRLLARYIPKGLFERPKMGFALPLDLWLRGELRDMLKDYLSWERLSEEGIFSPSAVHAYLKEHLEGRAAHHHRLWSIMMWEMWRDRWLKGGKP
jgi:asparagine synthase (glutamine-hydrolysing)